ncbi:MAG: hypothetical protein ABIR70_15500 [Bryobacteraceae bacterium]
MIFLITVAAPVLIGYLLVRALLPTLKPAWVGILLTLSLGAGCGVALLSLLRFLGQITIGAFWISEIVLLCGVYFLRRDDRVQGESRAINAWGWLLGAVLAVAVGMQIVNFSRVSEGMPHGQWDAWAIWNLRAAFLAEPGAAWRGGFSPLLSDFPGNFATHPDYPMLLSEYVARCWALTGSRETAVPIFVAALFSFATVALLVSALTYLRSWTIGAIGGLILLSNATFTLNTSTQYADVPLSFFFLATGVLLLLADADREGPGYAMILAGFMAGCAAWTKNEGLVFAAVVSLALCICVLLGKLPARRLLLFCSGLALPLAVVIYFKIVLAPGSLPVSLSHIGESARYTQILTAFWTEACSMGAGLSHPAAYLALAFLALGVSPRFLQSPLLRVSLGIWITMLAAYFVVYVVTPYDLAWHLGSSLGRVLTQLVPGATLLLLAICGTAEQTSAATPIEPKKRKRN